MWFDLGGQQLHLLQKEKPDTRSPRHFALRVKDVKAARELVATGETKPDARLNPSELAAWTVVANLVLNLDEVLNKS